MFCFLTLIADEIRVVADIVQIAAIIVAGLWTYKLFIKGRQHFSRALIKNEINHFMLDKNRRLIRLVIEINNVGNIAIYPTKGHSSIQQIFPITHKALKEIESKSFMNGIDPPEIDWDVLEEADFDLAQDESILEPEETMRIPMDFIIPGDAEIIQIHSMIYSGNGKDEIYWDDTVIVNMKRESVLKDENISILNVREPT